MGTSLYERIGGESAIVAAVDVFYQKVLDDDELRPFFSGLDMQAQMKKQVAFMTWALGGPVEYRGRDLRTAHAELVKERGLADRHFNAVARHLSATLADLGVSSVDAAEAMTRIHSLRNEVLGR